MIVCLCEGVSDREIETVIRQGAKTIEEISIRCGAGKGCGACHEQIIEILIEQKTVEPRAPYDISATGES